MFSLKMGAVLLAFVAPSTAQANSRHTYSRPDCPKTFTVAMDKRAALAVFHGTRNVSQREFQMMHRIMRCQRNPNARWFASWFNHHQYHLWQERRNPPAPPMSYTVASWYDDAGQTASGYHAGYGFAACGDGLCFPMGTRLRICYHGCVVAVRDDSGPYVGGRGIDLNQNVAAAIGFDGVDAVEYAVLS